MGYVDYITYLYFRKCCKVLMVLIIRCVFTWFYDFFSLVLVLVLVCLIVMGNVTSKHCSVLFSLLLMRYLYLITVHQKSGVTWHHCFSWSWWLCAICHNWTVDGELPDLPFTHFTQISSCVGYLFIHYSVTVVST